MKFFEKYLDETVRAIEYLTRNNFNALISVKKVRDYYHIDPLDHSKINFYWRSLLLLEQEGILESEGPHMPRRYRVFNYFKLFEIFYNVYEKEELMI